MVSPEFDLMVNVVPKIWVVYGAHLRAVDRRRARVGSAAVEVWQVNPVSAQIAEAEARAEAQAAANALRPDTQKPYQAQP